MSVHFDIVPSKTAVVVHDLVKHFIDPKVPGYHPYTEQVKEKIHLLLDAARSAGIEVVFIAPIPKERFGPTGHEVPAEFGPVNGDVVISKTRYGGFFGSNLEAHLRESGKECIILCGFALQGGVDVTLRDAFNRHFQVILASDATDAKAMADQGWGALTREQVEALYYTVYAQKFARVAATKEIIQEIRLENIAV